MSLINTELPVGANGVIIASQSVYKPSEPAAKVLQLVKSHFTQGDTVMRKPRREFNDLSVLERMTVDQMSFNTYQPNNGDPLIQDRINSWRSLAMRPIVRNKVVSIAAHATAKLIFPKLFAYNSNSEEQADAAQVMTDLMEWAGDKADYSKTNLFATISALVNPVSIVHTEYAEVFREVKREKEGDKWKTEKIIDEEYSGFKQTIVPVDEFFIPNFYENNVQKQDWVIWRRVNSYDTMYGKYNAKYDNFKYVKPGMQVLYNDADTTFYEVYDSNMRQNMCEEILYWNRALDLFLIVVNGVLLTEHDNPNPRNDKQFPFATFGYELIDEGKCFYYKSLVFKMQQDAKIINTIYPMIIDGTYLNLMPPMINKGSEMIASDVMVPGAVTTLSDPNADLKPIGTSQNLSAGMNTLFKVEESVNQTTDDQIFPAGAKGAETAYEISKREQEAATVLGLFIQMRSIFVKNFGKLMIGDILQYLTIGEVDSILGNDELFYKTFLIPNKNSNGKQKTRKIKFDAGLPDTLKSKDEELDMSFSLLEEQGGADSDTEIYKVNPKLFRELTFLCSMTPDVENPMSDDLKRAFVYELYDRAHLDPAFEQTEISKLLLKTNPETSSDVNKFMKKEQPMDANQVLNQAISGGKGFNPANLPVKGPGVPQIPTAKQTINNLTTL